MSANNKVGNMSKPHIQHNGLNTLRVVRHYIAVGLLAFSTHLTDIRTSSGLLKFELHRLLMSEPFPDRDEVFVHRNRPRGSLRGSYQVNLFLSLSSAAFMRTRSDIDGCWIDKCRS